MAVGVEGTMVGIEVGLEGIMVGLAVGEEVGTNCTYKEEQ